MIRLALATLAGVVRPSTWRDPYAGSTPRLSEILAEISTVETPAARESDLLNASGGLA